VARGTQHRKRRPRPNARAAAAVAAPAKAQRRQKPPQWQEQLFFQRLRNHAKWLYVALAVCFAATFALLGVGSGANGIGDALQNFFSRHGSSGASISHLQDKVAQHPNSATDWRALATALEQKHRTTDAINALERYTALKPKDGGALTELAAEYSQQASDLQAQATTAQEQSTLANPSTAFEPPASTPLGKVFTSTTGGLESPITSVLSQSVGSQATTLYQQYSSVLSKREDVYKRVTKLSPSDASAQIQLGQAAIDSGDTPTAIAAFKKFLKLAPKDPEASYVRSALKQLQPPKKK
jgi:cytochrome c-type biogenesis protein CcmH/NrfG